MKPIIIFDKSFLQSVTVDESVWLDNFFYTIVSPIFYIETLADLNKFANDDVASENEVRKIAEKFPDFHGTPCAFHLELAKENLLGTKIPMGRQIPVGSGRPVRKNGKSGIVYEPSLEQSAFSRWSSGQFFELERNEASIWRKNLAELDLEKIQILLKRFSNLKCHSFDEAKKVSENILSEHGRSHECMEMLCYILRINDPMVHRSILKRWSISNYQSIDIYAPYAAFVFKVEIFFLLSIESSLISSQRKSNYIDISYLCYLPFSNIFATTDKQQKKWAKFFLRPDQEIIWGDDLKNGLKEINSYYLKVSDEEKEKGILSFAPIPPTEKNFYIAKIWDQYCKGWRTKERKHNLSETNDLNPLTEAMGFAGAPTLLPKEIDFNLQDPDTLTVKRLVRAKKGGWYQLPIDI